MMPSSKRRLRIALSRSLKIHSSIAAETVEREYPSKRCIKDIQPPCSPFWQTQFHGGHPRRFRKLSTVCRSKRGCRGTAQAPLDSLLRYMLNAKMLSEVKYSNFQYQQPANREQFSLLFPCFRVCLDSNVQYRLAYYRLISNIQIPFHGLFLIYL